MKQALGGAAALAAIAWMLFVFANPEPCERIQRAAAPVRASFDLARWAAKNWLTMESRIDMIRWSLDADSASQRFLTRQFYGEGAQCVAMSPAAPDGHDLPAVSPVLPDVAPALPAVTPAQVASGAGSA